MSKIERSEHPPVAPAPLPTPSAGEPPAAIAAVIVVALLVFVLAYISPVANFNADPGLALVASQALIEHQTLRLDSYSRSELAYDLATDIRTRSYRGAHYPNSLGVPVLSVPAVWVANRLGFDMLDQRTEFATQNLLSALSCALLFVLWFRLCRLYLEGAASVTVAAVSMLGTSAMSTGATALWNSDYSLIFVTLALQHLARRDTGHANTLNLPYLGMLLVAGFACRPSTGIFAVAVLVYLTGESSRRIAWGAGAALAGLVAVVLVPTVLPLPWMAGHYAPTRLRFTQPLGTGLFGILLSPSRGLFVYSPFLGLTVAGSVRYAVSLWSDRLFRLCSIWVVLHTLAVASNDGRWWGGHSFGPRMLIDLVPGFVVLTCLVARSLHVSTPSTRRSWAIAYLLLAIPAIAIHSGQGLFNRATQQWNLNPNIDLDPGLAMDWRYPQFLATERQVEDRWDDYERRLVEERRRLLQPYAPGEPIRFDSAEVIFVHWYEPDQGWRWTRGERASVILRLPEFDGGGDLHVLEVLAGSLGNQRVSIFVNGAAAGEFDLLGFDPVRRRVPVPGDILDPGADNTIELRVSDPASTPGDLRRLGVALRSLRLVPVAAEPVEISFADDAFFEEGFSDAESGWRWTEQTTARFAYPIGSVSAEREYVLTIVGRGLGAQRVEAAVNGQPIGGDVVGSELSTTSWSFPGTLLQANRLNAIELTLPEAVAPPNDPRRLGLALVSAGIAPAPPDQGR